MEGNESEKLTLKSFLKKFHFLTLCTNALWWLYEEMSLYAASNNDRIHKTLSKINPKGDTYIPHLKPQCLI